LHVTDDMSCVWPDTVSITVISNYFRREKRRLTVRGFPPSSWFAIPDSTLFITITLSHSSSCFFISLLFLFYLLLHSCLTKRRCMSQHQSQSRPLVLRQAQEASLLSLKHSSSRTYQTLSTILITSAPGRTWGASNPSCGYPRFLCPPPCHRQGGLQNNTKRSSMRAVAGSPLSCASHRWGCGSAVVSRWGRVVQAVDLATTDSSSHVSSSRR
jgi:hypothetical protein